MLDKFVTSAKKGLLALEGVCQVCRAGRVPMVYA